MNRGVGVTILVVAGLLLTSAGGAAIVAAPLTLLLLLLVVRAHPTPAFRVAGAVVGGLTSAEVAWALLYLLAGEVPVAIWLFPVAAGLATAYGFLRVRPADGAGAVPWGPARR